MYISLFTEAKHVFLSRPRRFGKSLLLSPLSNHISKGERVLFEGLLAISRHEQ
ncbi:AAA family ATPase [Muribaculum intestinale]|uniref:AAA family ATPase n=1 Tax=Muribaculum intestinale TaxID=1796646 RepID=UPI003F671D22